jgi:GWxTD domain-containing protein
MRPTPCSRPATAERYTQWVTEDVAYLITDAERAAFKRLESNEERDHFVEQFWLRRDPTPDTVKNEFKEQHYRRLAYANQNFASSVPGWKTDRGRIYITYGPPDEKESHASSTGAHSFFASEEWHYHYIEGVGTNIVIEFVNTPGTGEYRMTADPAAIAKLRAPGDWPVTNADTPKSGAIGLMMGQGSVLISIPLTAYGDHLVRVDWRFLRNDGKQYLFAASIQGPVPVYTHYMELAKGTYTLKIEVKDMVTGKLAADTIKFELPN